MANILDYVDWRGDISFKNSPFNEVDNLILSTISYVDLSEVMPKEESITKITIKEASEKLFELHDIEKLNAGVLIPHEVFELFKKIGQTNRFGNLELSYYVNHIDEVYEKQFSAVSVYLPDRTVFVSFRGTDDTIVGWKEDFNMCFQSPVPSQLEAVAYLKQTLKFTRRKIRLGGHSKGGNLAIYSAAFSGQRARKRVIAVYNNDGPGFVEEIANSEEVLEIKDKIYTFVPQSSVIGMLMSRKEDYQVVCSSEKGLMQHSPFSWQILGTKFIYKDELDSTSQLIDTSVKDWLSKLDNEEKREFIDSLFQVLTQESDYNNLSDFSIKDLTKVVKGLGNTDEHTKKMLKNGIISFAKIAGKNMREGHKHK